MPPKIRNSARKTPQLTNKVLLGNELFSMVLDSVATVQDNLAGDLFEKFFKDVGNLTARVDSEKFSAEQLRQAICGDLEPTIVEMKTREVIFSAPSTSSGVPKEKKAKKVVENREERAETPPINALTDAEIEDVAIPRTLLRMQQMSISKPASLSRNLENSATPRRNPPREAHHTPRNIFPTTPARATPARATPARGTPARVAPRTPHQVIPFIERGQDQKQKHADELRNRVLEEKREKARQEEMKRNAVKARKEEMERERAQKIDEMKRKEERNAQFIKQQQHQKVLKSPTRKPLVVKNSTRKVFEPEEGASTPGRAPAKKGRVEVVSQGGPVVTVAQPTRISPSRDLPRSLARPVKEEPMESDDVAIKPKAKAKRSHPVPSEAEKAAAAAALQAEQERYLIQQAAEAKARAEEEQRLKEKKEAEKRAEAARRLQAEEEKARLLAVQKEEEEKLKAQRAREEEELKATLAKQAEKKAKMEAKGKPAAPLVYEMTPPRTYQANSKNDYGLHDLNSDDETDQEDDPRKEVPAWADFAVVRDNVRKQLVNPPFDVDKFFGIIEKPNLKDIFGPTIKEKRRGSSAVWKSSPSSASARTPLDDISE